MDYVNANGLRIRINRLGESKRHILQSSIPFTRKHFVSSEMFTIKFNKEEICGQISFKGIKKMLIITQKNIQYEDKSRY